MSHFLLREGVMYSRRKKSNGKVQKWVERYFTLDNVGTLCEYRSLADWERGAAALDHFVVHELKTLQIMQEHAKKKQQGPATVLLCIERVKYDLVQVSTNDHTCLVNWLLSMQFLMKLGRVATENDVPELSECLQLEGQAGDVTIGDDTEDDMDDFLVVGSTAKKSEKGSSGKNGDKASSQKEKDGKSSETEQKVTEAEESNVSAKETGSLSFRPQPAETATTMRARQAQAIALYRWLMHVCRDKPVANPAMDDVVRLLCTGASLKRVVVSLTHHDLVDEGDSPASGAAKRAKEISSALTHVRAHNSSSLEFPSIGMSSLMRRENKAVIELAWSLFVCFELVNVNYRGDVGVRGLLRWVRAVCESDVQHEDIVEDEAEQARLLCGEVGNVRSMCAFLDRLCSGSGVDVLIRTAGQIEALNSAMQNAEMAFLVPRVVEVEEFLGNVDECVLIIFLTLLWNCGGSSYV